MPSTMLFPQSGGIGLVSGQIFSGTGYPIGGIQLVMDSDAPGPVYVGLQWFSGGVAAASGGAVTINSGGSLSSGGATDGIRVNPGTNYFVPRSRLSSGVLSIRLAVPAASSGGRLYWEHL